MYIEVQLKCTSKTCIPPKHLPCRLQIKSKVSHAYLFQWIKAGNACIKVSVRPNLCLQATERTTGSCIATTKGVDTCKKGDQYRVSEQRKMVSTSYTSSKNPVCITSLPEDYSENNLSKQSTVRSTPDHLQSPPNYG